VSTVVYEKVSETMVKYHLHLCTMWHCVRARLRRGWWSITWSQVLLDLETVPSCSITH